MAGIKGDDIFVAVDEKQVLHATNHSFDTSMEMKEFRTKDTNGKDNSPGDITFSVSGECIVSKDIIEGRMTATEVMDIMLSKKRLDLALMLPGLAKKYVGTGYFTKWALSSPTGDDSTYSYEIVGNGPPVGVDIVTPASAVKK